MSLAELLDRSTRHRSAHARPPTSRARTSSRAPNVWARYSPKPAWTTGQVVAAMLPNDATTIAALFGTWRAGGVYTPLNPRAADAELASQLETLRPVAVITTPELAERFSAFGLPVVAGTDLSWTTTPGRTSTAATHGNTTPT